MLTLICIDATKISTVEDLISSLCHLVDTSIAMFYDPCALHRDTCMALCPGKDVERTGWTWAKICLLHQSHPARDILYTLYHISGTVQATVHVGLMRREVCVSSVGSE